jgi:branched-chain amino acid transport system ATP-binding protein
MILEVSGLRAGYGDVPVLHGIDFAVKPQEFVGILGHNGMGKSTLLGALMGRIKAREGRVKFDGRDVTKLGAHRRSALGMGLVPQGREIFPNLTVLENLEIARATRPGDPKPVIEAALEDFPRLRRLLDRRGGALSGGEQQLLALARCLCADPSLILLDEPTEGIQPSIIEEIVETLQVVKKRRELVHRAGGAESRLHRLAGRARADHPARPPHPRNSPIGAVRRRDGRRVRRLFAMTRAAARKAQPRTGARSPARP